MRTCWLGWVAIACAGSVAQAEKATSTAAVKTTASAAAVDPDPVLGVLDLSNLRSLTNDPMLGKADRIDGDEREGVVAFTFDDGPNPETTPSVIDALEKYDVPATFFIVTQRISGKHGARGRAILDRMLESGFELGSHSVSHRSLKKVTAKILETEIDGSLRALAPHARRSIGLFRPPFGAFNQLGAARLRKLGLTDVRWSVDTLDWKAKSAPKLRAKVMAMIVKQRGGVVLMHDVKPITAQVISEVLDDLEAENCQRLAAMQEPILPVSIHYFLKDGKAARPIPEAVKQRTAAYRAALPVRCAARTPRAPEAVPTPDPVPAVTPANSPKPK